MRSTLLTCVDEPALPIIEEAVVRCLLRVRRQTTQGMRGARLSRYGARLLNTFEEGRENTHVFVNVQNEGTLRRYGGWWSSIIAYLVRTHTSCDIAEPRPKPAITEDMMDELAAVVSHAENTLTIKMTSLSGQTSQARALVGLLNFLLASLPAQTSHFYPVIPVRNIFNHKSYTVVSRINIIELIESYTGPSRSLNISKISILLFAVRILSSTEQATSQATCTTPKLLLTAQSASWRLSVSAICLSTVSLCA